jgi:hypothetical protein
MSIDAETKNMHQISQEMKWNKKYCIDVQEQMNFIHNAKFGYKAYLIG